MRPTFTLKHLKHLDLFRRERISLDHMEVLHIKPAFASGLRISF